LDVRDISAGVHILSIGGDALTNGGALLITPTFPVGPHPVVWVGGGETASVVGVPVPTSVVQYLSLIGILGFGKNSEPLWSA
jgi:hypothetical protein